MKYKRKHGGRKKRVARFLLSYSGRKAKKEYQEYIAFKKKWHILLPEM